MLQLEPFQADVGDTVQVEEVLQLSDDYRRAFALRLDGDVAELGLGCRKTIQYRMIDARRNVG